MDHLPDTSHLPEPASFAKNPYAPSTLALHADSHLHPTPDIAPPIHLSTTFSYAQDPDALSPASQQSHPHPADSHVYSRHTTPNTTRLESILSSLLHGPCLTYSSGLSALHALYVFLHPRRVSISAVDGYHGSRGVLSLHEKLHGLKVLPLDCAAEELGEGDIIHLETPVNPIGEARNIAFYAEKAHSSGAYLVVDATFGPPGLQEPFMWGADVVVHSGTKYLGGHSDLLMGVVAVDPKLEEKQRREGKEEWIRAMARERVFLGSVMGSLEGWLGVRSLRTLEVRLKRQSESAGRLVEWIDSCLRLPSDPKAVNGDVEIPVTHVDRDDRDSLAIHACVESIRHASLQSSDIDAWLARQMPNGFGPVFAIYMKTEDMARRLPSKLELFSHATSLGGVESLIEWRAMSDEGVDRRLMRVSVGLEEWGDLRLDLGNGCRALIEEETKGEGKVVYGSRDG